MSCCVENGKSAFTLAAGSESSQLEQMKFLNVVLLGAPGVGKGTYANKLISLLRIPHISSGDLLRAEVAKKSPIGLAAQPIMISGNLVDSSVVQPLLRARLAQNDVVTANGCLLDGFPRNEQQAWNISEVLPGKDVTMALHLSLRRDLLLRKICFRRVCTTCSTSYNLAHIVEGDINMPALLPKVSGMCDHCNTKLVQRADDQIETVRERLAAYDATSTPLIEYYKQRGTLLNFELTSGVADMWPKLEKAVTEWLKR